MKTRNFLNTAKSGFLLIYLLIISCTSEKAPEPVDCDANPVSIDNFSTTEATCGLDDGSITVNASGGSGDYLYSINESDFQMENTFSDLMAGNYSVTVMDVNECSVSSSVTVESDVGMTIDTEVTTDAGCGMEMGVVSVTVSGGQSPYQFKTEGGSYQDSPDLSGLVAGPVTVFAMDANGCEVSSMIDVTAGTSLEDEVMPLLEANCALSGCHDGNSSLPDWTVKENVIDNATNIKNRTGDGSMPPGDRTITEEEIQTIACWVDDGAENN